MRRPVTPSQFLVPLAGALFFVAEILAFGEDDASLLRLQVFGVLVLAALGGCRMGMWTGDRQAAAHIGSPERPEHRPGPPSH
jgi:hypothetical protein